MIALAYIAVFCLLCGAVLVVVWRVTGAPSWLVQDAPDWVDEFEHELDRERSR